MGGFKSFQVCLYFDKEYFNLHREDFVLFTPIGDGIFASLDLV